ncbi:FMN-dependent NADH-azoreductase [Burkholderia sp. L27(2015)]|uniref:FMN-dependent NADH-azoreductase n=1 Tax=Burkholderia sp. L27(2015) TaxID=1641858 RepID=UPI00131D7DCF|nr:NAD(P)H-dependent oxidoreductase [Burkholderia sp. L27(2015)]
MRLLHIEASPRKQRSASRQVALAFIEAWQRHHPESTIDTLDVWNAELPEFDGAALDAKYAGLTGRSRTPEEEQVWKDIEALAARFHQADVLVFSVPMWNFGIPYRLKHLIDAISQKDVLFSFDERGLIGMLAGRKAVTVAARGVSLGGDFPEIDYDYQAAYMAMWYRMVGITDIHSITVDKTLMGDEADTASRGQACQEAVALAAAL